MFFRILFIINFSFCFNFALGQNIAAVRKQVQQINGEKKYEVKTFGNDFFADVKNENYDNGQELTGYFKKKELKKMTHVVGLSAWKVVTDYYFKRNSLIFVHRTRYQILGENGYLDKQEKLGEQKFYFHHSKVLKKNIQGAISQDDENVVLAQAAELKVYLSQNKQ